MPQTFNRQAKVYLSAFMDNLRKEEAFELVILSKGWETVKLNLEDVILNLSTLQIKSLNQLLIEKKYKEFLIQAERELSKYSVEASQTIAVVQGEFARAGLSTTQGLITTLTREFNLLPVDAINKMIGFTSDGSPLVEILIKRYGEDAKRVGNTLIEATSLGLNPKETTKLIGETLDGSLYDTLRIARTEQIRVFREAGIMQMEESGVVKGYQLVLEPDACPICESQANQIFGFDESPELHPNCRCIFSPVI